MNNSSRLLAALSLGIALTSLALCPACVSSSTPSGGDSVEVQVASIQNITVDGSVVRLSQLPGRLKSMGATKRTRIMVVVAEDAPKGTDEKVKDDLVQAGFPKVVRVIKKPPSAKTGRIKSQSQLPTPPPAQPAVPVTKPTPIKKK